MSMMLGNLIEKSIYYLMLSVVVFAQVGVWKDVCVQTMTTSFHNLPLRKFRRFTPMYTKQNDQTEIRNESTKWNEMEMEMKIQYYFI